MNYKSEKFTCTDPKTGAEVTRLTSLRCNSSHLYFTNNCFFDNGKRLVFESDRGGKCNNLFSLELETGEIEQLTDLPALDYPQQHPLQTAFVDKNSAVCCFFMNGELQVLDIKTKSMRAIYRAPEGYLNHISSITADGKYVLTSVFENKLSASDEHDVHSVFETQPHSMILRIPVEGGEAEVLHEGIYLAHVNASPTDSNLLTFCHEGPWQKVHRLWLMRIAEREVKKLHPCMEKEWIGHEYWYADGRRIGYHGQSPAGKQLGRISVDSLEDKTAAFPFNTGHIFSQDERLIIGDGGREGRYLRLFCMLEDGTYEAPRALCLHNCTFKRQRAHVHP